MLNPTNTTSEPAFSLDTVPDKRILCDYSIKMTEF
jgi:hypothetical protein